MQNLPKIARQTLKMQHMLQDVWTVFHHFDTCIKWSKAKDVITKSSDLICRRSESTGFYVKETNEKDTRKPTNLQYYIKYILRSINFVG